MAENEQHQANMLGARDKQPKVRHRASVACCACRERRTRCVVPAGQQQCVQCKDAGQPCIIKHDDERRKPNSKAYVNSLHDRIAHLESLLEDRDNRSPVSRSPSLRQTTNSISLQQNQFSPTSSTDTFNFAVPQIPPNDFPSLSTQGLIRDADSPANSTLSTSSSNKSTISRLLSPKGHLSFDQLSGRLRWFGATRNCHIYGDLAGEREETNRRALEQRRHTDRVLSTLPKSTQDYLLQMFFQYYNSVIHVIHQSAFEEGMNAGQGPFFSPFLLICVLAIGFRHADKTRPDIMKIALPGKESTLHREAKYMLDYELERPGGVTSIQALLLLGDLECGVGRDNLGWLISGMAMRILFDAGLHLAHQSGMSQLEIEIGRMTLWACVIYDRYWALFLGRPTALKPEDLEVYRLAQQFERLGTLEPAGPSRSMEKQIYEALLDLMELAGKITEIMDQASKPNVGLDQHVYVTASALTFELETWYTRLPRSLQWSAENISGAPFSYFLLHQQFHAAIILLHRQFAQYDDIVAGANEHGSETGDCSLESSHFATLSRMKCTKSAGRMAQIFWQHRQMYDTKKIFVTGLQHAGTAAIALVTAVASPKDQISYDTNMRYLECLAASIDEMAETYQPAERMSAVLKAVLEELKEARPPDTYSKAIPARRGSADCEAEDVTSTKRHQSNRPDSSRTNSQQHRRPECLQDQQRRHIATGMPPPSITTATNRSNGASLYNTPNADDFVLMPQQPDHPVAQVSWTKYDEANNLSLEDSIFAYEFGRPASPSQFRSAWMGAETPSFSPIPTGTNAPAFLNTPTPDLANSDRPEPGNTSQPQDGFSSHTNLDFLSLLNTSDQVNTGNENFEQNTSVNGALQTHNGNAQPFDSLPTPVSQTTSSGNTPPVTAVPGTKTGMKSSKSQSHQKPAAKTAADSRGISQTMAGLDDIWKEMMRTNQNAMASVK